MSPSQAPAEPAQLDPDLLGRVLTVSRRMAETRALAPLLEEVVDELIRLTGAERGYVVLDRPDGSLDFRVTRTRDGLPLPNAGDQISKTVLRQVIDSGEPLLSNDAMSDARFAEAQSVVHLKLRSIMCVPLTSRGETLGGLYVENRSFTGRFDRGDLPPLILFANQAAVSIENAALNDQLEARVAARTAELQQALNHIERSWTEAIEANRVKTSLLADVAHDLRAPLSIVVGSLALLQKGVWGSLQPEQAEWVDKSLEAVSHVSQLAGDLFDLARIDLDKLALYRETVALSKFLEDLYGVALGLRWPEGVALRLEAPADLPAAALDPMRIRQVLFNLLSNALRFTHQGSVTLHARSLPEASQVLIGVADTGEGIPPDQAAQLFERFQQVSSDVEQRRAGAGLGLAISRELVEMHGGRIWVESTPGQGSDFQFTLPLAPPEPT